jgi:hypothetical protein
MKIRASTRRRGKGDIRDDNGIGHLTLTAENNDEREFITSVYRILVENEETQEQGVATMRRFLSEFPETGPRQERIEK